MKRSLGARTLAMPAPVWLVGTYDAEGSPNIMTAAWAGICCSKPPCVNVSLRKATYSYGSIQARKAFTVNIPSEAYVKEADYAGIASGARTDKFMAAGLTPAAGDLVDAPYVKEFPLILECRLIQTLELGLHTLFVGEIMDVKAEDSVIGEDGLPAPDRVRPIVFTPETRRYYGLGEHLGQAFTLGKEV